MPVLVFDVNETLLDLRDLDPVFEDIFGDAGIREQWFRQVLLSAMTLTVTGHYRDFSEIGAAALRMLGRYYGEPVGDREIGRLAEALRSLSPHPDAKEGLGRLRDRGHRLAALSNSPVRVLQRQLQDSGLARFFEARYSVEETGSLKPAPSVYRAAAARLGVAPEGMMLVAAHGWDLAGAATAGCRTALIARSGQVPEPLYPDPELEVGDLRELASRLPETAD